MFVDHWFYNNKPIIAKLHIGHSEFLTKNSDYSFLLTAQHFLETVFNNVAWNIIINTLVDPSISFFNLCLLIIISKAQGLALLVINTLVCDRKEIYFIKLKFNVLTLMLIFLFNSKTRMSR